MEFTSLLQLLNRLQALGASRVFCKRLSENDNSKQQIYLGSSFEVLSFFPFGEVKSYPALSQPNFKAPLKFFWVTPDGCEQAVDTKLILYPAYPEVRLSGFLRGCSISPSDCMQPIPRGERQREDRRVLIFGTSKDGRTFSHLARPGSQISEEILTKFASEQKPHLFLELTRPIGALANKSDVLFALRTIHEAGYHPSCRLNAAGKKIPYHATNGGGFTLEALLDIVPNGSANPDYLGWEIKSYSKSRITLMTPEPDGGLYREIGASEFVIKYGHATSEMVTYFTGAHYANKPCDSTGMTMQLIGYDPRNPQKLDPGGAVCIIDSSGELAASWSFAALLSHWNRKHAFAAYVPCRSESEPKRYFYDSPILMGEHTDFSKYLNALSRGLIVFDPGSKVTKTTKRSNVKARSQFRTSVRNLPALYEVFTHEML